MAGIVVGVSGPNETVVWHFVPFLARDFASFAADADTGIGKEADFDVIVDERMPPLIRALRFLRQSSSIDLSVQTVTHQILSWEMLPAAVVPDANSMGHPPVHIF